VWPTLTPSCICQDISASNCNARYGFLLTVCAAEARKVFGVRWPCIRAIEYGIPEFDSNLGSGES